MSSVEDMYASASLEDHHLKTYTYAASCIGSAAVVEAPSGLIMDVKNVHSRAWHAAAKEAKAQGMSGQEVKDFVQRKGFTWSTTVH